MQVVNVKKKKRSFLRPNKEALVCIVANEQNHNTVAFNAVFPQCHAWRTCPVIDTVLSTSVTLRLWFMSLVITALQLRQKINNTATF